MNFLDTSVLIAASLTRHEHHTESAALLRDARRANTACALHSLAETYSTLSGMPRPFRMPPAAALSVVQRIRARLRTVALTETEYFFTMESLAPRGLMGGIVFDALLMRCARKVGATRIYSLNEGDFKLVDPELAAKVARP